MITCPVIPGEILLCNINNMDTRDEVGMTSANWQCKLLHDTDCLPGNVNVILVTSNKEQVQMM